MRLLVLNWLDRENPDAGGAELHLHEAFGRIAGAGHEVTVITSGWGAGEAAETELDGIRVHRVGTRYTYPLRVRGLALQLIRSRGIDLLVEDLNKVPVFTPLWSPVPVVLLVHHLFGDTVFREASLPLALATWTLERPIGRVYHRVPTIAVSESTAADLVGRGIDPDGVRVVHNGVDPAAFGSEPATEYPSLLYLGRLKRYKRLDLVLEALAVVRRRGLDARFRIAGTGDAEAELRGLAASLELDGAVEFLGFVTEEEKRSLFGESWVHVFTSEKEGWGLTTIEAAACGTPTIASDSPGLRDSVRNGQTGILVEHGNVGALADAFTRLLSDDGLRAELGEGARRFAKSLSWQNTADGVLAVLTSELARGGG